MENDFMVLIEYFTAKTFIISYYLLPKYIFNIYILIICNYL